MIQLLKTFQAACWLNKLDFVQPDLETEGNLQKVLHIEAFLINSIENGLLPGRKKLREKSDTRALTKAINKHVKGKAKDKPFIPPDYPIYDYYVSMEDIADFSHKPSKLADWGLTEIDEKSSSYPHSRTALAKTLWIFLRLYTKTLKADSRNLVAKALLEHAQQEVSDLEEDGQLAASHGLGDTTVEGCIREAIDAGKVILTDDE